MSSDEVYLSLLKPLLPKGHPVSAYSKVIYLGAYDYTLSSSSQLNASIKDSSLKTYLDAIPYDINRDAVHVYYIACTNGSAYIVSVCEPFEPFYKDELLDIIPCDQEVIVGLDQELLFLKGSG